MMSGRPKEARARLRQSVDWNPEFGTGFLYLAKALLAVAAGKSFTIRFNGSIALQHAEDTAQIFIRAADAGHRGAAQGAECD